MPTKELPALEIDGVKYNAVLLHPEDIGDIEMETKHLAALVAALPKEALIQVFLEVPDERRRELWDEWLLPETEAAVELSEARRERDEAVNRAVDAETKLAHMYETWGRPTRQKRPDEIHEFEGSKGSKVCKHCGCDEFWGEACTNNAKYLETLKAQPITELTDNEIEYLHERDPEWWNALSEPVEPKSTLWVYAVIEGGSASIQGVTYVLPEHLQHAGRLGCLALLDFDTNEIRDVRGPFSEV